MSSRKARACIDQVHADIRRTNRIAARRRVLGEANGNEPKPGDDNYVPQYPGVVEDEERLRQFAGGTSRPGGI